jgi:hypothetical protein
MTSRTEPDLVSNWYYEADSTGAACAKGVGKLCQLTATNGYSRRYVCDSMGRFDLPPSTVPSESWKSG